ncbi:3D-(3,5/4)-trihydroxycyclohexane-1,2-dione hydrolase [Acidothermus cellulolyticus 11B]|uniref:3D-(3,5/4)-trihydroxycyclohexane-1,2-dione hydrolase n=1 Tax=Acidothermus cellulolyticus (strain ATCC 43068 / DSM 8971 / 11B) TaxID=351607 RepID=A0LVW2_ACIC1|nr:3D-(3,5/4)-trihydroxycyclohexane-1,2-dione acylhydrolase (decyclizing) [Acidothermus cellulolyticus]ABK53572.1 3D-(3,5/4)-trihydroxycyclohexane-1,2-dione hydrolase [Acidothermus cellulolyticus 11B]
MAKTVRLTVAQALIRFLRAQYSERDGSRQRLIAGCFGIFGHGNVAGIGEALLEEEIANPGLFPYYQARNEQAMVHIAAEYARMTNRLSTLACTTSIGPGATNLVTGAALATINRLPVLLLPGDIFATRVADPVLQQLETRWGFDVSVNDTLRPVSRYFDRIWRPEQLPRSLLAAMQVLTDPAETGAVTLALPQDVQAQAYDWPVELFAERVWPIRRTPPDPAALRRAVEAVTASSRPLIVAGGGVIYSDATDALRAFVDATGIPVAVTQAGKPAIRYDHPLCLGAIGSTGTPAANAMASTADLVLGIGTRFGDFTTASSTIFGAPDVRFVHLNITPSDAAKLAALPVVADARAGLDALREALAGWRVPEEYSAEARRQADAWRATVFDVYRQRSSGLPRQSEVIGAVGEAAGETGTVICAAGSLPGDLHKLWRARDPRSYHVEYGYSCMGFEIPAGIGAKLACPDREIFVMVGDGSYLMLPGELVTAVQEQIKIIVVLLDNHGFASIGSLSESVGGQRFGTNYRYRSRLTGRLDGDILPIDFTANAASLGMVAWRAETVDELRGLLEKAKAETRPVLICIETDPTPSAPDSEAWWDVPVAEVSDLESTRAAYAEYQAAKARQRPYL